MAKSVLGFLVLAALQGGATDMSQDFSGILNDKDNAIRSCTVVNRADGDHVLIDMAKHGAGDALHIEAIEGDAAYDYLFGNAAGSSKRRATTSVTLGTRDRIDIPVRKALGLRGKRVEPIFSANGNYSIYIGFGFRGADEAEIYGACTISITAN